MNRLDDTEHLRRAMVTLSVLRGWGAEAGWIRLANADLARAVGVGGATAPCVLGRLEADGLIEREVVGAVRRMRLTQAGAAQLDRWLDAAASRRAPAPRAGNSRRLPNIAGVSASGLDRGGRAYG